MKCQIHNCNNEATETQLWYLPYASSKDDYFEIHVCKKHKKRIENE